MKKSIVLLLLSLSFNLAAQQEEIRRDTTSMYEIIEIPIEEEPTDTIFIEDYEELETISDFEVVDLDSIQKAYEDSIKAIVIPKPMKMTERLAQISKESEYELEIDFDEIMSYIRKTEIVPISERDDNNSYIADDIALKRYLKKRNIEATDTTAAFLRLLKEWYDYENFWDPTWGYEDKMVVSSLFTPLVFKATNLLPHDITIFRANELPETVQLNIPLEVPDLDYWKNLIERDSLEKSVQDYILTTQPLHVRYSQESLPTVEKETVIMGKPLQKVFEAEAIIPSESAKVDRYVTKVKNWIVHYDGSIHFTQNYFSPNWTGGGNNTTSLLSVQTLTANYDSRKSLKWVNTLTWRLGFMTTPNDSLRSFMSNDDQFRIDSKLMYKAFGKFDYTVSGAFTTRFFDVYKPNTNTMTGDFFSPATGNINIGLNFSHTNKKKTFTISPLLAPFAVNWNYVGSRTMNPDPNPRATTTLGSSISATMTWNITKYIVWSSRVYAYTSYKSTTIEFENTISMILNRYLSTKIYLYPRFDDSKPSTKTFLDSYFQLKETLSFGLNFRI